MIGGQASDLTHPPARRKEDNPQQNCIDSALRAAPNRSQQNTGFFGGYDAGPSGPTTINTFGQNSNHGSCTQIEKGHQHKDNDHKSNEVVRKQQTARQNDHRRICNPPRR
jgi:hypothetical protein